MTEEPLHGISTPDLVHGTVPMNKIPDEEVRRNAICARCGYPYFPAQSPYFPAQAKAQSSTPCKHHGTGRTDITPEHATRIRAAYAIGKAMNPDHDHTSYYLQTLASNEEYTVGPLGI